MLRKFIEDFLQSICADKEELQAAAEKWDVKENTAYQVWKGARGSGPLMAAIALGGFNVGPDEALAALNRIKKLLREPRSENHIEQLIDDVRARFSDPEFIAELKLLLARDELYRSVGLRKRPVGRPKKPR